MKAWDNFKVRLGKWATSPSRKTATRGYGAITAMGGQMSDWILRGLSEDADIFENIAKLRSRSRDLFKENPFMRKFRSDLIANVFGSEGITLQMKIKEEADRVVYAAEEKAWLEAKQRSYDEWQERARAIKKQRPEFKSPFLRTRQFMQVETTGHNGSTRAKATVKVGQPDVYANNLIERAYKRWQKKENCTVSKKHTYQQTREHRLVMCARDGGCFIRLVRGFDNDFDFAIELIADEFIDHNLNRILRDGNEIKMGIEYNGWGEPVAYYVKKRVAGDWQWSYDNGIISYGGLAYERIRANEMIHYCAFEDSGAGRGVPWIVSVMSKLRHLDKYEEAEVIAARAEACKGGHYEATVSGLDAPELADKIDSGKNELTEEVEPGMWKALPYGWKANAHSPTHPNGNLPEFKKAAGRTIACGVGDFYNTMFNDMEGVNYTSSRTGLLDVRELWMMMQRFDIDTAERPIFEAWLEWSLTFGKIPLPVAKFEKFNQSKFQGRRWPWVDPLKDAKADATAIDALLTSRTRICNENGDDFEEIVEEQAIEKILIEEAGLSVSNAAEIPEENPDGTMNEPAKTPGNGKKPAKKADELQNSRL